MTNSAPANVRLGHLVHLDGRHDASGNSLAFESILKGKPIYYGGQHSHVVTLNAIHVVSGRSNAAEDVSASKHQANLHSGSGHLGNLFRESCDAFRIEPERQRARQSL